MTQIGRKEFHSAKDKYTSFVSKGSGEAQECKVVDALTRKEEIIEGNLVSEWSFRGEIKFRLTTKPITEGEVFSSQKYELFI